MCIVGYNSLKQDAVPARRLKYLARALVCGKLKTIVLFVQLYYYTSIDEVSLNDIFDG